jgi:FtsP/CotA-like multicopper oxidase with cupredoxin domain
VRRRDFVKWGGAAAIAAGAGKLLSAQMQSGMQMHGNSVTPKTTKADFTLQIAPVALELAPNRIISTIGYNGTCPGPLLRMKEGVPVTVDVINDTDTPEFVHWHGLFVPSEVDGAEEEGTPPVPPIGGLRARGGITPTQWPAPIFTRERTRDNSDFL